MAFLAIVQTHQFMSYVPNGVSLRPVNIRSVLHPLNPTSRVAGVAVRNFHSSSAAWSVDTDNEKTERFIAPAKSTHFCNYSSDHSSGEGYARKKKSKQAIFLGSAPPPQDPVSTILNTLRLDKLAADLAKKIIGQDEAIDSIVKALHLHVAGIGDPNLPIANLLFMGTTGVGKTALAQELAKAIKGEILQIDMSKYTHPAYVSGLIGTTQGFVGYKEGGLLTNAVLKNGQLVILFDELEKADPSFYKLLLSILGSGTITDNKGQVVNFNKCIIICTTNACSEEITRLFNKNFKPQQIEEAIRPELMRVFSPEFYGRMTPIVFNQASEASIRQVINKMLQDAVSRIEIKRRVYVNLSPYLVEYIKEKGFNSKLGYRPTARCIESEVIVRIAYLINKGAILPGHSIDVAIKNGEVHVEPTTLQGTVDEQNPLIKVRLMRNLVADNKLEKVKKYYQRWLPELRSLPLWPEGFAELSYEVAQYAFTHKEADFAISIYRMLADREHSKALALMGHILIRKDIASQKEALELFRRAADYGDPYGHYNLGYIYFNGLADEDIDLLLADEYFRKAAAKGDKDLQYVVGQFYFSKSPIKDYKFGYSCYVKGAELDSADCCFALAKYYLEFEDNKPRVALGIKYLLKASRLGHAESLIFLSRIHGSGLHGMPYNRQLADKYSKKYAALKNPKVETPLVQHEKIDNWMARLETSAGLRPTQPDNRSILSWFLYGSTGKL